MKFHLVDQVWQLALVYEVRRQTLMNGKTVPLDVEFDEVFGQMYQYALVAADSKDKGIATLRINYIDDKTAKLERVSVIPQYQGKGIGTSLLQRTEDELRKLSVEKILIHSFEPAVDFYLKNGYTIDESTQIHSSIPQIAVRKKLLIKERI
ncbi:GNAT family N-acetyltransferase [Jeotgalibaca sp. A127]|uniref:GNAT family N-acetyltransferase n=1 Tax=Jeotgalibaca sp. A127 TaxID=3457324 RepID=UPI003FD42FB4